MIKFLTLALSACMATSGAAAAMTNSVESKQANLTSGCKSAYLMDYDSGECIYKENEKQRMPIASVCKVMTLTLCFDAIAHNNLSLTDKITVSDRAAGMGGSQVFLESGLTYTADQLIKSIIVCSANDSCVAMSEAVCGSEDEFVAKMNKKAAELGCTDTLFANCTGLPKDTQYSCAHDVALMFKNLLSYENYYLYSKIWLEDFVHPDERTTSMTNTNKLIRKYKYCDGGKTGFTNEAGFCLAATAKKNDLRLISVVLGADTSDHRFQSTVKMFDFGFANYKNRIVLDKNINLNDEFEVSGGKKRTLVVKPQRNSYIFSPVENMPEISHSVISYNLKAPIEEGQEVGKIEVYKDGVLADTVNVVAAEKIEKAGFGDYFILEAENWAL